MQNYDTIIIGAGHNGLTCAAYLAKAGQRVLVVEKRHVVGGATVTEEIVPGFQFTVFSYLVSLLRTEIIHELELVKHGLMLLPFETTLDLAPDGRRLFRESDHYRTYRNIAQHSLRDAEAYDDYKLTMRHLAHALRYVMHNAPPNLDWQTQSPEAMADLIRHMRQLEPRHQHMLVRAMTMSAADFLRQWFENDLFIAGLSTSGLIGSMVGPFTPGSALVLLYHYLGELEGNYRDWRFHKGGTGGLAKVIGRSAEAFGAEIRLNAPVGRLLLEGDTVRGVILESGEEIRAQRVMSSVTPQLTYLKFAGEENLPSELVQSLKNWNSWGSAGKVNIALRETPRFVGLENETAHLAGAFSFNVSLEGFERAYDEAKYGDYSQQPYIDAGLISMADPDMAPPGKQVMTCFVMYAPYHLRVGTWPERREEFGKNVLANIGRYIHNFEDIVEGVQVNTPWDIEERIGITGGNIFHGELSLAQLFWGRPAVGYSGYRTPLHNYYTCGSSAHPGGAISGAPGRNAALAVLAGEQG